MTLQPAALIQSKKQWGGFIVFTLFAASIQLLFYYQDYKEFISKERHKRYATVLNHYEKKDYQVLKLQSGKLRFYTTTRQNFGDLSGDRIALLLFPKNADIGFDDYLDSFYTPSYILQSYPQNDPIKEFFTSQHADNPLFQELYGALFLATPVSKELRELVATFGISHLIALSGFHLSLLSAILYFLLKPLYRPLQQNYFPHRQALKDLGLVAALLLGGYLYLTDFPPSLVRSYAMFLTGWLCVISGVSILSYGFLAFVVLALLAIDVRLAFSLGFFFSVSGVFYIYLLLDWLKERNRWLLTLAITFWTFLAMLPVAHYFFGATSPWQLLSPLLTLLFTIFYPLALALHLLGLGSGMEFTLPQNPTQTQVYTPQWFFYAYLLLSLLAIKDRFKPLLLLAALGFGSYLFILK